MHTYRLLSRLAGIAALGACAHFAQVQARAESAAGARQHDHARAVCGEPVDGRSELAA